MAVIAGGGSSRAAIAYIDGAPRHPRGRGGELSAGELLDRHRRQSVRLCFQPIV